MNEWRKEGEKEVSDRWMDRLVGFYGLIHVGEWMDYGKNENHENIVWTFSEIDNCLPVKFGVWKWVLVHCIIRRILHWFVDLFAWLVSRKCECVDGSLTVL